MNSPFSDRRTSSSRSQSRPKRQDQGRSQSKANKAGKSKFAKPTKPIKPIKAGLKPIRRKPVESTPVAIDDQVEQDLAIPNQEEGGEEESSDLIFGRHTVLAALAAEATLNRIWITPQLRYNSKFMPLIEAAKSRGTLIDEVTPQRLSLITEGANHQGIAAQSTPYTYTDLTELIEQALSQTPNPVIVALDGVQDPHNLGAIARTAEALGMQGLVIPQRRAVAVTSSVIRVAAGALSTLPVSRVVNLNRALETFKEAGFWIYGTVGHSQDSLYHVTFKGPIVIVVGAEGKGISLLTQQHCDQLISIPLSGKTESLNASVAAGITLYELCRQRWQRTIELRR